MTVVLPSREVASNVKVTSTLPEDIFAVNSVSAVTGFPLTDTIFFKGLVPNLEYVATGRLMDVETEEPLLDGLPG